MTGREGYVPLEVLLEQHPCWCGRPAVEVISSGGSDVPLRIRGYCERHCQRSTTTITRPRQDGPR